MKFPWFYPPILAYHRIHPDGAKDTPTLHPSAFERQMKLLAERWRPIPLDQLVRTLEQGKETPPRSVIVTFDDGTVDFSEYAVPILNRHRIPATVFMIVKNVGKPGWLSQEQLRSLPKQGITVGSHTLAHDYLPAVPLDRAKESLSSSKETLGRLVGPLEFLSYPLGGYTPEVAALARSLGYRAACTTNRGTARFPADLWALRRITMHANVKTPFDLWLRCCGYYGLNRRLRTPG